MHVVHCTCQYTHLHDAFMVPYSVHCEGGHSGRVPPVNSLSQTISKSSHATQTDTSPTHLGQVIKCRAQYLEVTLLTFWVQYTVYIGNRINCYRANISLVAIASELTL